MIAHNTTGRALLISAALALVSTQAPQAALADCASVDKKLRSAVSSGDRASFPALLQDILGSSGCDSNYQTKARRVMALASLKSIAVESNKLGPERTLAELEQAATIAQPWQLMVTLGDAYYDRKKWKEAFRAYESALDDMRDTQANPKAPPESIERHALKRAQQARALSPVFIASRSLRGRPTGSTALKFRNFSVVAVPVPVRFEFNSARLTPDGEAAAKEILAFLQSSKGKGVKLIGHTDPIGSDAYNLGLSQARAEAVRQYLLSNGYAGQIIVEGHGEREPFKADDPGKYTQEELYAMYRRVEFQPLP